MLAKIITRSLIVASVVLVIISLYLHYNALSYALAGKTSSQHVEPVTHTDIFESSNEAALEMTAFEQAALKSSKKYPRIIIPSIAVNAHVENVGVTAQGSMGVPKNPLNAAWYEIGPKPGEAGSAVIDGHVNWYNGASAVFKNLSKLKLGDKIVIENEANKPVTFIVRGSKVFDPAADAVAVFSSNDGQAHLNLITCGGVWNKVTKQYSERLVIFADKVTE